MEPTKKRGGKSLRLQEGGHPVIVTFRTNGPRLCPADLEIVLKAAMHFDGERYVLYAAVCMPDHVHLILRALPDRSGGMWSLSQVIHSIKSYSAHRMNARMARTGTVWQEGFFDRIVRSERDLERKVRYVWENPLRKGLVEDPMEYAFSYNRWLHGQRNA